MDEEFPVKPITTGMDDNDLGSDKECTSQCLLPSGLSKSIDQRCSNVSILDEFTITAPPKAETLVSVGLALPP